MSKKNKKKKPKKIIKISKRLRLALSKEYVSIYQEEADLLSRYILDYPDSETGGQLFGHWTYDYRPIVCVVIGPGPGASHETTFFKQDIDYLRSCARFLKEKYGLDHIGEWHSHHQLGLPKPSQYDSTNISTNIKILGYEKFLLCIGTYYNQSSSLKAFLFTNGETSGKQIPFLLDTRKNSYRSGIEQCSEHIFLYPKTPLPNMRGFIQKNLSTEHFDNNYFPYWLSDKNNVIVLKNIIEYINSFPSQKCTPYIDRNNRIHLTIYQNDKEMFEIYFPELFPKNAPLFFKGWRNLIINTSWWFYSGDILQSFISYYKHIEDYDYSEPISSGDQCPSPFLTE